MFCFCTWTITIDVNNSKTVVIQAVLNSTLIDRISSFKNLGVMIDQLKINEQS